MTHKTPDYLLRFYKLVEILHFKHNSTQKKANFARINYLITACYPNTIKN